MAKGGAQQAPTQTTQTVLSPEQRQLMQLAMPGVREFAAQTPERYQGPTTAGFNPTQMAGQEAALGAAGTQASLAGAGAGTAGAYLGQDPNARRDEAIRAAVDPIYEGLTERALPAIRGEAITTGGFGGSRQGIAEQGAIRDASRLAGDTAAKMSANIYDTDVKAQLSAMGMLPAIQGIQTAPALTTSAVGDVRQALEQRALDEQAQDFYFQQYAPFLQSKEIMALLQGLPGGATVSTGSVPQANPTGQALGGAMSGASLGAMLGGPWGAAAGGLGGAVLPFLLG